MIIKNMSHYDTNGKQKIAMTKSKEMSRSEPAPLEKMNWLIHLQHVRGEINLCKELIRKEILKSNGRNEYLYFKQGVILRDEGKVQEALESFQKCLKLNPESAENIKEVAKCLYLLRRFRLALEAYLEAERVASKSDWEIYHNVGQCLVRLGDESKAKEYLTKAVQIGKQECSYDLLMKILISKKGYRSAIAVCNSAIENCPDSVAMLTESGLLHLKSGQMQLAFERLSSALALEPQCPKALLGIGCITQTHEEYDVALSKYKVALHNEPECAALWNNIGMCFHSKQKHVAAISCLKRALWLSPLNWKVLVNLGLVHLSTYQPASAFNFLCAAVNLRPDVALSFMILGCTLLELNDNENALRAFRQAISMAPADPLIVLNTAVCLLKCSCDEEALELVRGFKENGQNDANVLSKEVVDLHARLEQQFMASANCENNETTDQNITVQNDEDINNAVGDKGGDKSPEEANHNPVGDAAGVLDGEIAGRKDEPPPSRTLAVDEV